MSAGNEPVFPAPIEVDLDYFQLMDDNSFRISLRFQNGAIVSFDLQPDTEGHDRIVEVLGETTQARLARLVEQGMLVTTPSGTDDGVDES